MERTPNRSQHTKFTLKEKDLPAAPAGIRTRNLSITGPALTNMLSWRNKLNYEAFLHCFLSFVVVVVLTVHWPN